MSFMMRFYQDGDDGRSCWVPLGKGSTALRLSSLKRVEAPEDTKFNLSKLNGEGNSWGTTLSLSNIEVWAMIALNQTCF